MFKHTAIVASLGALVAAQSFQLSQQCQSAVTAITSNSEANTCTNVNGLLNILLVPANSSLVQPITSFVQGFCSAPACSNDTIQAVAANISTNCATDLQGLGVTSADLQDVVGLVQQFFPLAKEVACLDDTSNHEFCVTEILNNFQTFTGQPLTINNLKNALPMLEGDAAGVASGAQQLPASLTCTPCVQAAYITLKDALPGTINGTAEKSAIVQQCGEAFEAADATPSGIVVATGTDAAAATKTGAAFHTVATPAAALFALAAVFITLA